MGVNANAPPIVRPTHIGERPFSWLVPFSFFVGLLIAVTSLTEIYGYLLRYNAALGPKLWGHIYEPFAILVWANKFYSPVAHLFHKPFLIYPKFVYDQFKLMPYVGGFAGGLGFAFAAVISYRTQGSSNGKTGDIYDSAGKFANEQDAIDDGLLGGKAGPIIGGFKVGGKVVPLRYGGELGISYTEPPGGGKALEVNTPVATPTGFRRLGDLVVGDRVIGRDGKPTTVVGVFPQGQRPAFRVSFSDGVSTVCCDEHLWSVQTKDARLNGRKPWILPLAEVRRLLSTRVATDFRLAIPLCAPIEFDSRPLYIDPYVLGVLLGDGHLRPHVSPTFTSTDSFIVEEVSRLLRPDGLDVIPIGNTYGYRIVRRDHREGRQCSACDGPFVPTGSLQKYCILCRAGARRQSARESLARQRVSRRVTAAESRVGRPAAQELASVRGPRWNAHYRNSLTRALAGRSVCVGSAEKFIPDDYLYASVKDRVAILQGLLDTDGNAHHAGCIVEYTTTSEKLSQNVSFLVRSLGGTVSVAVRRTTYRYNGELRSGRVSYQMHAKIPNGIIPFRLPRKVAGFCERTKYPILRTFESIEPVGIREMVCIAVDAPDQLYVVEQSCIVTHNSSLLKSNFLIPLQHSDAKRWTPMQRRMHPWGEEPIIIASDPKFELFRETAGYQSRVLGKSVKLLCPLGASAAVDVNPADFSCYNPLWVARIGSEFGVQDCLDRTLSIIDGEGEGLKSHWDRTALSWGAAILEKLAYRAVNYGDPEIFSLPGLQDFVFSFSSMALLLDHMMGEEDDPAGVCGWMKTLPDGRVVPTKVKPSIEQAAAEFAAKDPKESSSVFSSFIAFLAPYRSEILRRYITKSTFNWKDMANDKERSAVVYIGIDPLAIPKARPYLRMVTSSALEELTSGGTADMGGRSARGNLRPAIIGMDEVAAWKRLQEIEQGAGFFRGYGIFLWLIWQSVAQKELHYGKTSTLIDETMGVLLFGRPVKAAGARAIQEELGERIELVSKRSLAGNRFALLQQQASDSLDPIKLPLLSTKEIQSISKACYFAFVNGHTYYLSKWEYFKDQILKPRAKIPYPREFGSDKVDEPPFVRSIRLGLTVEQLAAWNEKILVNIKRNRAAETPAVDPAADAAAATKSVTPFVQADVVGRAEAIAQASARGAAAAVGRVAASPPPVGRPPASATPEPPVRRPPAAAAAGASGDIRELELRRGLEVPGPSASVPSASGSSTDAPASVSSPIVIPTAKPYIYVAQIVKANSIEDAYARTVKQMREDCDWQAAETERIEAATTTQRREQWRSDVAVAAAASPTHATSASPAVSSASSKSTSSSAALER